MNHAHFFVDTVIVHEVLSFRDRTEDHSVTLSDVASDIDTELRHFFRERIIESIASGFDVEEDPDQDSPVPGAVARILDSSDHLVSESQVIARHLHGSQTAVNSSGLVVVCTGDIDGEAALAILKLQRQEAIRAQLSSSDDHTTFDLAHLKDLMLSEDTRVFKVALFAKGDPLVGRASDNQRGYEPREAVANFFLVRFLGCKLRHQPDLATKAFLESTQDFINEKVADPEKKARYGIALIQELNSQSSEVNVARFAQQNLDSEDRATYRAHMSAQDEPPSTFHKDVGLIESRLRRMSASFGSSDLKLSGSAEAFDEFVDVREGTDADGPQVTIRDGISQLS